MGGGGQKGKSMRAIVTAIGVEKKYFVKKKVKTEVLLAQTI